MALPEEITLKAEIKQISDKIDSIINTVNQFYPMDKISTPEQHEESDQQDG